MTPHLWTVAGASAAITVLAILGAVLAVVEWRWRRLVREANRKMAADQAAYEAWLAGPRTALPPRRPDRLG